ncbi:thyroid receptor-interacting protein 11-like [Callospermophilus lateralis]|uniref:thyroid receptor-interacting protein 11-like n=1 Tax=Callospermophilus lateralis TaxID=76772 RepID=UPI0040548C70
MSSWLGGLGSGLGHFLGQVGSSLASLTGHISSFTREMLLDDLGDLEAALHHCWGKEMETTDSTLRCENERLKKYCTDLEEKHEASQLQINHQSVSYQNQLQQKEVEISHLKARQTVLQNQVFQLQAAAPWVPSGACGVPTTTALAPFGSGISSHFSAFRDDDIDFSDTVLSQQETSRLSIKVARYESEVDHSRQIAEAQGKYHSDTSEICKVQNTIKTLQPNQSPDIDDHQHEMSVLEQSSTVAEKGKILPQSSAVEEVFRLKQALADAEKEIMRLNGLNQDNRLAEDNLKLKMHVEALEKEKSSLSQEKEELQMSLSKLSCDHQVMKNRASTDMNLNVQLLDLQVRLKAKEEELHETINEKKMLIAELEELDHQNQEATKHMILIKDELSKQQNEGDLVIKKLEQELDDEKKRVHQLEDDQMNISQELHVQKEKLTGNAQSLSDLHLTKQKLEGKVEDLVDQLNQSQKNSLNIQQENLGLKDHIRQIEDELSGFKSKYRSSLNEDSNSHCKDDMLKEREAEISNLRQNLSEVEQLNENLKKVAIDLKTENEMLILAREDVRRKLEESIAANNQISQEKDTIMETLKRDKEEIEAKLHQAEKRLLEEANNHRQTIQELSNAHNLNTSALQLKHECVVQLNQEKDFEIAGLKRNIEQMTADEKETEEILASYVEEQEQLIQVINEKEVFIEKLEEKSSELQKDLDKCSQALRENETLRQVIERKDRNLTYMKAENNYLQLELETLREQQNQAVPVAEPKALDAITELELEVSQLNIVKNHLEDEIKDHLNVIENQKQRKMQLLQSLQEQKEEMDEFKYQYEQMNAAHSQLLLDKEEEIKNLQTTIEKIKAQLPGERGDAQTLNSDIFQETKVKIVRTKEVQYLQDQELRLNRELERLRSHLLESEESYTQEILAAEDKEIQLRQKVTLLEDKLATSSKASHQASVQIESLQEQLSLVSQQRDENALQLSLCQERTAKGKRPEVLQLMGSILDIPKDEMEQLLHKDYGGVSKWMSSWLGGASKSVSDIPLRPNQQPVLNSSFSELFVKFLESESHPSVSPPKVSAHATDCLDSPGRREQGVNVQGNVKDGAELRAGKSTNGNPLLVPRSAAVPLSNVAGVGLGGPGHPLFKPIADFMPTFTPLLVSMDNSARLVRWITEVAAMSSWLGGLGSGLGHFLGQVGSSLASLTGHISSFTREMLLDDLGDLEAALHHCWGKEMETTDSTLRCENERLKKYCTDLEEKHEASQLQINHQSVSYQNQLQQKEVEISHLKARQTVLQNQVFQLQAAAPWVPSGACGVPTTTALAPFGSGISSHFSAFRDDDMDFSDTVLSQQETSRLSIKVARYESEVDHSRQIAEAQGKYHSDTSEICKVQNTIKTLQPNQSPDIDDHQHEILNIQQENLGLKDHIRQIEDELSGFKSKYRSSLNEDSNSHCKDDMLKEREAEISNLRQVIERKDRNLTYMKAENNYLQLELETLREQQNQAVPVAEPKALDAITELELEVSQLNIVKNHLEDEIKDHLNVIENQKQRKMQLLQSLQEQKEEMDEFKYQYEQMNAAHKTKVKIVRTKEVQYLQDQELRLNRELERLRSHLLESEESYTQEILAAEDKEIQLRQKVTLLEDKLATSSKASHQASVQIESLQEQLSLVSQQRDENALQLSLCQERVRKLALSSSNLQRVLEHFQEEEKAMHSAELAKEKQAVAEWKNKAEKLEGEVSSLQEHLHEANAMLDSASKLREDLDLKEEQMEELKKQNELRKEMLDHAQQKLSTLVNSTEGKVDKVLMRNLFIGHFKTAKGKRPEVLQLMGSILDIPKDEMEQLLHKDYGGVSKWMSSWLGGASKSVSDIPLRPNQQPVLNSSFSELFVKFLESESHPSVSPPKVSAHATDCLDSPGRREQGVNVQGNVKDGAELRAGKSTNGNPLLVPRSAAVPLSNVAGVGLGGPGHPLFKPIADFMPTFTPLLVSMDNSARVGLQDLLNI